jgi:mRNA interferase RelE/StbE
MIKTYTVIFSEAAGKQLSKMDRPVAKRILDWTEKYLEGTTDPRAHGKELAGDLRGFWRYRVGKYRLIADIRDDEIIIEIVSVGHRANVYDTVM